MSDATARDIEGLSSEVSKMTTAGDKKPVDLTAFFGSSDDECPICLEKMDPITSGEKERRRFVCCGNFYCGNCAVRITEKAGEELAKLKQAIQQTGQVDQAKVKQFESLCNCCMCRAPLAGDPKDTFAQTMNHAKKNAAWAQLSIGHRYMDGIGVETNLVEAVRWFKLAAEQGHPWAMAKYGLCLFNGTGIGQSLPNAVVWYKRSADLGFAVAQTYLGSLYMLGQGVRKDPKEALRLFLLAANQGCSEAQNALGYCFASGDGVAQDLEHALHWYTKAAEQGDADAMWSVGKILLQHACAKSGDVTVIGTLPRAMKWFRKAASLGHANAIKSAAKYERASSMRCANCLKPKSENGSLSKCKKCKVMRYCSKDCQVAHWRAGHKQECCE
mmetsp:Transcript_14256/g.31859  ORF Transcript_14256/g.31859 Transcript_14256/m.31859 type:complete len:387 (-) Transcript_14256:238-1398(-)